MNEWITIKSPATISNLVCGFDVLGLAIDEPSDLMHLRLLNEPLITIIHEDGFGLPTEPMDNVAGVVLNSIMEKNGKKNGFEIRIMKNIKPGSGIGSSAASAAGAAFGANQLLGDIFSLEELVSFAMEGEQLASGSRHADNIAPCLYGGITLVRSLDPFDVISIPILPLYVTVIHPQIEIKTSYARQILKEEVPLKLAVHQWANVGALVAGFFKKDYELIARSMEDEIVEPVRSPLIPGFDKLKKHCLDAGALGGGISGAGPSMFMFSIDRETGERVEKAMRSVYIDLGIPFHTYVSTISSKGVQLIT